MRVPFRVLSRVLLRAPLLRVRALARGAEALLAHPLGRGALELASRELAAALRRRSADERTTAARARRAQDERTDAAIARYARRAAFRPTPSGWLAGVALGEVAERTAIATGAPVAHLRPAWARLDAAARGVLDDAAVRRHVRLRLAPSLLIGGGQAAWLALQADGVVIREVEIDEVLGALIAVASARGPVPWSRARRLVARAAHPERGRPPADEDVDSFLLRLIDDGFLEADVTPPLVGPPPDVWLARRLRELHKLSGGRAVGRAAAAAGAVLGPPTASRVPPPRRRRRSRAHRPRAAGGT